MYISSHSIDFCGYKNHLVLFKEKGSLYPRRHSIIVLVMNINNTGFSLIAGRAPQAADGGGGGEKDDGWTTVRR